jgi:hypothetical protein
MFIGISPSLGLQVVTCITYIPNFMTARCPVSSTKKALLVSKAFTDTRKNVLVYCVVNRADSAKF